MKLLITGAGGQLGQEWVHFCKNNKIEYSAYSSKNLNLLDEDSLTNIFEQDNPDILINCAAYTKVDQAEDEPKLAGLVNSESLKFICELCSIHQTKLVHYSTDYVFSGSEDDRKEVPEGYPEDFKTNPINSYGLSKRRGELAIMESGCKYMIIRVSWLCGQFGNNFVKTMLKLGEDRDKLTVVNDQFGSPTFADQVVDQTYELLNQDKAGIFHLSSEGITTWFEFAKEIFNQKGFNVEIKPVNSSQFTTKATRPYFSKLSTQKISTIDGIKILSWQEGLKKLLNAL